MLQTLPHEVLEHIFHYLLNDGASLSRLSLSSQFLYRHIAIDNPELWQKAIQYRWPTTFPSDEIEHNTIPRSLYIQRHAIDRRANEILEQLTKYLKDSLRIPDDAERIDGNCHVGKVWDHFLWKHLMMMQGNVVDFLQQQARITVTPTGIFSFDDRFKSFLAAQALNVIQFAQCLYKWKQIQEQSAVYADTNNGRLPASFNALMVEKYALLVNEMQQSPDQVVMHAIPSFNRSIVSELDHLAEKCKERIRAQEIPDNTSLTTLEKIQIVNDQLFSQEMFKGNTEDYYNYRNSLLGHVLETKKGIPITLAILYTCVCRRLNLDVHLIGLPGHVVIGFSTEGTDGNGQMQYVDVFDQGSLMTRQDCERICLSQNIPLDEQYLQPCPANQVLQRIFNNLANCHLHALATNQGHFHTDLFYRQRALASIHQQPDAISTLLVNRVARELPLTLSRDLLRFYSLLSPADNHHGNENQTDSRPHAS